MSRVGRLLDLLHHLRSHRFPVSAATLADDLRVSPRTVYRDIAVLRTQGARIDGEAGIGYVLRPGVLLPPLMFSNEEIEALVLGSRWVADRGDVRLGEAARGALVKIGAVLPAELRDDLDTSGLLVGPRAAIAAGDANLASIRRAIRDEHKLDIAYKDVRDRATTRKVWPVALAFFDRVRIMVAWCELREGYRHFRTDRITALSPTGDRYPRRRRVLLAEWRAQEQVPAP